MKAGDDQKPDRCTQNDPSFFFIEATFGELAQKHSNERRGTGRNDHEQHGQNQFATVRFDVTQQANKVGIEFT